MNVQKRVWLALAKGPMTVNQLAIEVGAHPQNVRVALWALRDEGLVVKAGPAMEMTGRGRFAYLWQPASKQVAA